MNVYYIGNETHRIDTSPSGERLWIEFMDAIAALDAHQDYVSDLQSRISDKDDEIADLRLKIDDLEERVAKFEAEAGGNE